MQKQNNFIPNCSKCSWDYSDTYDRCVDESMTYDEIIDYSVCFFVRRRKPCKICKVKNHSLNFCNSCIWGESDV